MRGCAFLLVFTRTVKIFTIFMIFTFLFLSDNNIAFALMNSTNYQIWGDTVSTGGNRSTSAGYVIQDTVGEMATGENPLSTSYLLDAGFQALFPEPLLLMTISASTVALSPNPITNAAVSTGSYTVTISTNAPSGYTLSVVEDGDFRSGATPLTDVTDGTVTAGVNEYGISVSGSDAAFLDHRAVSGTPLVVASNISFISGNVSTITHHAATTGTATGAYAHSVTYIASSI